MPREVATMGSVPARDPRNESPEQRDDRNLAELLQELRVAGLGVQVLFGFLLSLPFTQRFSRLSHAQRELYTASIVLAAVATALLVGPVAYHRLVFRRHEKERLVRVANVMAMLGLATVALAVSAAVLLVTSYVTKGWPTVLISVVVAGLFGGLWFIFPLASRSPEPLKPEPLKPEPQLTEPDTAQQVLRKGQKG
jgi:MFS family permease